jgi:hypothetical protein
MVVFMIGLGRPFLSKRGVILCACRREGSPVQRATVLVHYGHRIMLVYRTSRRKRRLHLFPLIVYTCVYRLI